MPTPGTARLLSTRRAAAAHRSAGVPYPPTMEIEFSGEMWYWRGPAPWHFISVPEDQCAQLRAASDIVSYGWGMIPVAAQVGRTRWTTSLFPKDGAYIVPVKAAARKAESMLLGEVVQVRLTVTL